MKNIRTKLLEKKIPTLLGLGILVVGLVAGIFFIGSGPGIFAPRATPQTTPKQIKITNVTDTGFSISFITDEVTSSFVKYGTAPNSLKSQASDDRDSLSGNVGIYNTHHITVRSLQPQTTYYFVIGTGSSNTFDNNGQPYSVKTLTKISGATIAQTVYGTVLTQASTPAEGSMVYLNIEGTNELSTLVRSSGTWAIPLSQVRATEGNAQPKISTSTPMTVRVQGKGMNDTATLTTTVGQPQLPVETITLGQSTTSQPQPTATVEQTAGTNDDPNYTASESGQLETPTPTVTLADITPTVTVTASISAVPTATQEPMPTTDDVSVPSTESATPQSGAIDQTIFTILGGIVLVIIGIVLFTAIS